MNYTVLDDIGDFGTFTIKEVAILMADNVGGYVIEHETKQPDWETATPETAIHVSKNYKSIEF
jgi:hypothetical protein